MFLTSTRTPIGLDIGRRFIKAAQLRGNELLAAACIRRTGGDCMPGPGEIRPLADALRARPFQGRAVVVAMPHDKLLTSIVELPPRASGAPIEQLARSELARIHHKNAHGLEMAHWELPVSANASSRTMVMVTACVRDDADGLLDALEAEGLEVLTLAFPAAAALCACQALIEAEESGAVLDVGWQASRLILQHKGLIVYERSLEKCGLSATKTTTCVYGPYIRTVPALPVGAAKGNTGIATATGTGVGWIYDGAGNISTNTTGTEADSFGKLYSAY
jgi:Tfp pilus assembly PilM family ATPase